MYMLTLKPVKNAVHASNVYEATSVHYSHNAFQTMRCVLCCAVPIHLQEPVRGVQALDADHCRGEQDPGAG